MVNGRWIKWLICFDRGLPPGKCCCLLLLEYSHLTKFFQVNKDKNWIMAYHQMRCLSLALSWGFFVLLASWACITLLTFCLSFFFILFFCLAEQDHTGSSDIQRGSFQAFSGGTLGEHHQWCRADGRLFMHARWPARTHCGWMQRSPTGPSRLVERVHEQCEFPP